MKTLTLEKMSPKKIIALCRRPSTVTVKDMERTGKIISSVKKEGDRAVSRYTAMFDGANINNIKVSANKITRAWKTLNNQTRQALILAQKSIFDFHCLENPKDIHLAKNGAKLSRKSIAIEKVGLYIPSGQAPLVSTVLMLGVPAKIAGCKRVVICTPPSKSGEINSNILATAKIVGIQEIYRVGGVQAIAALAYGTESIPKVDKIFGPGNRFVTTAKMIVSADQDGAAIDMPAGPSELLVIADRFARADFIAADLLSQAEHSSDSQVILVCTDEIKIREIELEIRKQILGLPRKKIIEQVLEKSYSIIAKDVNSAIKFANTYAPEHLILNVKNFRSFEKKIQNAGSVFLGQLSPESAGDYASGPNHTLPTSGYARTWSGLSVESFTKNITFQELDQDAIKYLSSPVKTLAKIEGLEAHSKAMEIREKFNN